MTVPAASSSVSSSLSDPHRLDALVIGTGVGGGVAAPILRNAGLTVAVADERPYGGTCPLRGCEPKKVLADITGTVHRARCQKGSGLTGSLEVDWPALQRFKRSFTDPVPEYKEARYRDLGILTLHGTVRFLGPNRLRVGEETYEAERVLIATGSRPAPLSFPGAEHLIDSEAFLELEELPQRVVFVGGGYITLEFAHVCAVAGAKVTILQRSERLLRQFDAEVVDELRVATRDLGIDLLFDAPVERVERADPGYLVRYGEGGGKSVAADLVVHGAGRVANLDGLDLAAGQVAFSSKGVSVNAYLQSPTNPAVYAVGDVVTGSPPLTPVAVAQAEVAAHNMLHGPKREADLSVVPSVCFTHPPLAGVGLTGAEAMARNIPHDILAAANLGWSELRRLGEAHSAYKLLVDPERKTILGAHILGEDAEEMVNILALAMRHGLTLDDLEAMVWSYPSFGYAIRYMLGR